MSLWNTNCADLGPCCAGAGGADVELQPNASAPLLRTSKARREWIEQEMELCSTSWQYQKVSVMVAGAASSLLSTLCLTHKLLLQQLFPCAERAHLSSRTHQAS